MSVLKIARKRNLHSKKMFCPKIVHTVHSNAFFHFDAAGTCRHPSILSAENAQQLQLRYNEWTIEFVFAEKLQRYFCKDKDRVLQ